MWAHRRRRRRDRTAQASDDAGARQSSRLPAARYPQAGRRRCMGGGWPADPLRFAPDENAVPHAHDRDPSRQRRSPDPFADAAGATLAEQIGEAGRPRWIIGPNRLHYWWIPEWHAAVPDATVWLAPRIREQAGGRIDFDACTLDRDRGYPWDADIATLPITGDYMTEVVMFHRPSRTLVLTDLIENFEPRRLGFVTRWLSRGSPARRIPTARCRATCGRRSHDIGRACAWRSKR
jgi:hypothetical protein